MIKDNQGAEKLPTLADKQNTLRDLLQEKTKREVHLNKKAKHNWPLRGTLLTCVSVNQTEHKKTKATEVNQVMRMQIIKVSRSLETTKKRCTEGFNWDKLRDCVVYSFALVQLWIKAQRLEWQLAKVFFKKKRNTIQYNSMKSELNSDTIQ